MGPGSARRTSRSCGAAGGPGSKNSLLAEEEKTGQAGGKEGLTVSLGSGWKGGLGCRMELDQKPKCRGHGRGAGVSWTLTSHSQRNKPAWPGCSQNRVVTPSLLPSRSAKRAQGRTLTTGRSEERPCLAGCPIQACPPPLPPKLRRHICPCLARPAHPGPSPSLPSLFC